ncbi:hypothetical protein EKD04_009735 [Chloroflexales bacterium ZM16-3]|nr:hypothetical protein [Chloroflexales bacterium ZM16-3]
MSIPDRMLHTRPPAIEGEVYRTAIPLIVAERCRNPGRYDSVVLADGTIKLGARPEPPALLATWYSLRWLMLAFPEQSGFNQRQIAAIGGMDQKSVHPRLRKLLDLGLIVEAGRRVFDHLVGAGKTGGGKPKSQPIYTIPLRQLEHESSDQAEAIIAAWRVQLFDHTLTGMSLPPNQMALDLSDPVADQEVNLSDLASARVAQRANLSDPLPDQEVNFSDPLPDQEVNFSDPLPDQEVNFSDPLPDHMGRKEGRKERDALTRESEPPTPPAEEFPLGHHPLAMWHMVCPITDNLDDGALAQLASEHDVPTGGYGWYWVGRAILAVKLGGEVRDWLAAVRSTLRRWRSEGSYGSDRPDAPARLRRPRVGSQGSNSLGNAEPVDDTPLLYDPRLSGTERGTWLRRLRNAETQEAKHAVMARFRSEYPPQSEDAA